MNICYITREYPPELPTAGIGTYTQTIATILSLMGHEVHVICGTMRDDGYEYKERGVYIYRLPWKKGGRINVLPHLKYCLNVSRKARQICNTKGIDIIEVPDYLGQGIFLRASGIKCPIVIRFHGGQEIELNTRIPLRPSFYFMLMLEIIASWFVSAGTAPSKSAAKIARKKMYFKAMTLLPNFVKSDLCNVESNRKKNGDMRIIFVGRLEETKGPHYLSMAAAEMFYKFPSLQLVFVGKDTMFKRERMSMSEFCLSLIPDHFRGNVIFKGFLPHEEVIENMKECGIFCLPSLSESFGLVAIEAMLCELPVVGFKGTALEEIVLDGQTGYLVPKGDVKSLFNALQKLMSEPDLRRKMGENAKKAVLDSFSAEKVIQGFEEHYKRLILIKKA